MKRSSLSVGLLITLMACSSDPLPRSALLDPPSDAPAAPGNDASLPTPTSDSGARDASNGPDASPPPDPAPYCSPNAKVGVAGAIALPGQGTKRLLAITGDELTIAWASADDGVHTADRASSQDAFGALHDLSMVGIAGGERVALGQDGLSLYAIASSGHSILAFTRGQRTDAFGATDENVVSLLDQEGAAMAVDERFSDLTLAGSGNSLVLRRSGGMAPGLRIATRVLAGDPWSITTAFGVQPELALVGPLARHPSGLSTDTRALFYFDEVSNTERIAFFGADSTTASTFKDEGSRSSLQPNLDCTVVYWDDGGVIYAASRQ